RTLCPKCQLRGTCVTLGQEHDIHAMTRGTFWRAIAHSPPPLPWPGGNSAAGEVNKMGSCRMDAATFIGATLPQTVAIASTRTLAARSGSLRPGLHSVIGKPRRWITLWEMGEIGGTGLDSRVGISFHSAQGWRWSRNASGF